MFEYIKRLIDKTDAAEGHVFIALSASLALCVATLGVSFANIWVKKDLVAELLVLTGALAGLTGYNVKRNTESTTIINTKQKIETTNDTKQDGQ